jgi:hypothetical protein
MKNQIQDLEIMDSFYKENNQNQSMADLKGSLNNNNIINEEETNNNYIISPSMFTPKGEKKRRQGLWVNNFFTKEEEVKEETISSPQLIRIVQTNNIKTITIFFKVIEAIKNFVNSQTGIIIMLIVICFSIFFYDIKTLCLPVI